MINPPGKHPLPITAPELPSGLTRPTFKITGERHCQSSRPPKNSGFSPAYLAPYATATPVPPEEVQKLQAAHRATISVCNLSLVGARAGGKVEFARDPQAVYKYPATTSMEYGWNWKSKKTFEIYGTL